MACIQPHPTYLNWPFRGLKSLQSLGDGNRMELEWFRAYSNNINYGVVYNVYFSTNRDDVFTEGVKYVINDETQLKVVIPDFAPGDVFYLGVRAATQFRDYYNAASFPTVNDLNFYPEVILREAISDAALVIPIEDPEIMPAFGTARIGGELLFYDSVDVAGRALIVPDIADRGVFGTEAREHFPDGYDGVKTWDNPLVRIWTGWEDDNGAVSFQQSVYFPPNQAWTATDGYATQKDLVTTNLGANSEIQEGFEPYPFSGYRRLDPATLLSGACVGSYYGGEQGCADDTGSVDVEVRGIPFYVLNNQRQEVLLSVTGEPVVLCTRLYEGTRCSCVLMDRESPESRCRKCFHPDTPVRTREGWLPICEVREGEEVLTGEGRFKRVTEVHRTHHHGPLVGLGTAATATLVWSTPEHPVLALGGDHQKTQAAPCGPRGNCNAYIKRGDGVHSFPGSVHQLPSGRWHARATFEGRRRALGTFDSQKEAESHVHSFRETHLEPGHRTEWKQAGSIHKGEWLAMGWPCEERDVDQLGVPLEFLGPNDGGRNGPSSFAVDQEFLWVLGMYIAEGCPGTREIVFALHAEETHFAERIEQFFGNKGYGYKRASTSENGIAVRVYSTTLSEWFPSLTGKGCANKRIPETLMALPPEKTWALIGGIHDGDGSKSCHEIGQTSRILSLQITELLHRLGEQPLTRIQQSNILTPNGNRRKPCYVNSWREDSQPVGGNRKGRWKVGDTQLARVTQVQEMDYCGPVYNLEVEEDHTYSAQGLVVHNCFGTGFVGGYVQFDNGRRSDGRIMVHFDPAADDLPQVEQGIDLKYAPNAWTMTVPPIQVRDFLIRFNVPLLGETKPIQEFRYEVVGITRNKTVLNLYGAQKMTLRRIQKTDPIYQWRAVYDTAPAPWIIETSLGGVPGPGGIPPHFHSITVPGPVLDVRTVNGTTTYVRQHNHPVLAGVVQEVLGHTHKLLEPHPLNPDCPPPDPDLCPDPL